MQSDQSRACRGVTSATRNAPPMLHILRHFGRTIQQGFSLKVAKCLFRPDSFLPNLLSENGLLTACGGRGSYDSAAEFDGDVHLFAMPENGQFNDIPGIFAFDIP